MDRELLYAISNSSMDIYPENSRTKFSNKFPKEILIDSDTNSLWVSIETIIMENTIVQYKAMNNTPDIIWFSSNFHTSFTMPERCFDGPKSLEVFLKSQFRGEFKNSSIKDNTILNIYLKEDTFNTNKYH